MAKPPAFQWYPKDCDTDENVRAMSDQEFGFYMRCLNHCWLNAGLPAELPEMALVMGRKLSYVEKVWKRVGKCFEIRDGRFVNPKQEDQRGSAREFVESRRRAANMRWSSKQEQSTRNAHASTVQCSPLNTEEYIDPKQYAEAEAEAVRAGELIAMPLLGRHALDEGFMSFMQEFGEIRPLIEADYSLAYDEWLGISNLEKLKAIESLRERRALGLFSDANKVPMPQNWLKRKEFNRRVIRSPPPTGKTPIPQAAKRLEQMRSQLREPHDVR